MKIQSTHQCLWFSSWTSRLSHVHMALAEARPVNTSLSVPKTWHCHPTWNLRSELECNVQVHHLGACCWPVAWSGPCLPCLPCSRRTGLRQTQNLSALNLPKKDGSEQASSCLINNSSKSKTWKGKIRQVALKQTTKQTKNPQGKLIRNSIHQKMPCYSLWRFPLKIVKLMHTRKLLVVVCRMLTLSQNHLLSSGFTNTYC